jgi:hypothetical protein
MEKIILIALWLSFTAAVLSGCGTVKVSDNGSYKTIEYSNPPAISATPGGQFSIPQTQIELQAMANKECPNGYRILKQGLKSDKKAFFWNIECF